LLQGTFCGSDKPMEQQTFTVTITAAGQRLDVWLLAQVLAAEGPHALGEMGASRAEVQRWIKSGAVNLNNTLSANPAKKVREGEVFTLLPPPPAPRVLVGEDIPLDIYYEDAVLLVVNKPAGLTVHPAPGHYTGTLAHALIYHCGTSLSAENGTDRPGIVHRLDKDTSGLMVVAKTAGAHRHLARQFVRKGLDGALTRTYIGLVRGVMSPASGTITGNIGRHPTLRVPRAVVREGGKPAVTHYKTLEVFAKYASLLELQLETGRTHQIRVHLAHKGHGVVGDPLYPVGPGIHGAPPRGPLGGAAAAIALPPRQMLHAAGLGFIHPTTHKKMAFTAPLPADFAAVLAALRQL
jgi:23S rRNA pseudouridine1911/1915/1917 synthase